MPISFNEIPSQWRVPGTLVEFDNSMAMQGASLQEYTVLLCGSMLSAGTATADTAYLVTNETMANTLFGEGSIIAGMCASYLENNAVTGMYAIGLADDSSATAATASIELTGTVVTGAPINLYIGGKKIRCAAAASDTAATVATAMAAAINAEKSLPVTATASSGDVTLTAKNKGEEANFIDIRTSYYGEPLPTGLGIEITAFEDGAGNPDVSDALANIGDKWFHVMGFGVSDRANLRVIESELENRWGPLRHIDGVGIVCRNDSYSTLTAFGQGDDGQGNYAHVVIAESIGSPDLPWCRAAAIVGATAYYGSIDPARPFQTLELTGCLSPALADRLTQEEQNLLLFAGIATTYVDDGGVVRIQRLITNYQTNANGVSDTSYLDVTTLLTLSYTRFDFRARIMRKYPRHKLADDGNTFGAGQAIMTPSIGKSEALAAFVDWMQLGLVENLDAFKSQLVVERNALDPNRLDWRLPPDLVNGFIVGAVQIQFRL